MFRSIILIGYLLGIGTPIQAVTIEHIKGAEKAVFAIRQHIDPGSGQILQDVEPVKLAGEGGVVVKVSTDQLKDLTNILNIGAQIKGIIGAIKGVFRKANDDTGVFKPSQRPIPCGDPGQVGCFELALNPTSPIEVPGSYGIIDFSFTIDPTETHRPEFVEFLVTGSTAEEVVRNNIVPEPATMWLISLAAGLLIAYRLCNSRLPERVGASSRIR